jgi:hypothetical protein
VPSGRRVDAPSGRGGAGGSQGFGGVRIDGLISHAFLRRYVWTIDFEARQFRFGHVLDTKRDVHPEGLAPFVSEP